jgi:hypothetical protein
MPRNKFFAPGVLVLALVLGSAGPAFAAKAKPGEQGNWKVKVTPDAASAAKGEKEFDDTLVLSKGKFRSTACEPFGFGESPYRLEGNNWLTDGLSKKEGKNHWHGEIAGDSVTGQMTWTKPDGSVMNYTFTGTRAPAQSQTKSGKK